MKKAIVLMLGACLLASAAYANKPYGLAGCGLGSIAMGSDGNQILAATTNGTFYSQMFGITTGTSNCTDAGAIAQNKQVPFFIEANRVALANDIARGNGETVASLAQVMGCSDSARLAGQLQKNYSVIFPSEAVGTDEVAASIVSVAKSEGCTI